MQNVTTPSLILFQTAFDQYWVASYIQISTVITEMTKMPCKKYLGSHEKQKRKEIEAGA